MSQAQQSTQQQQQYFVVQTPSGPRRYVMQPITPLQGTMLMPNQQQQQGFMSNTPVQYQQQQQLQQLVVHQQPAVVPVVQQQLHQQSMPQSVQTNGVGAPIGASDKIQTEIVFYINGLKHVVRDIDPRTTLNDYIRSQPDLTGTKHSCGEGGCGACAVMMTYFDFFQGKEVNIAINSCLRPLLGVDGAAITTTEGIGNSREGFHPIQQQLADNNGSQCGFCSPGMVMNMYSLLKNNPNPPQQLIEDSFDGNICRCTGYRPILNAMKTFASDYDPKESPCKRKGVVDIEDLIHPHPRVCEKKSKVVKSTVVDPHELAKFLRERPKQVKVGASGIQWISPITMQGVFDLLNAYPNPSTRKLIVGNTSIGIYKDTPPPVHINLRSVPELNLVQTTASGLKFGAAVSINRVISTLQQSVATNKSYQTHLFPPLIKHMLRVANVPVRNIASWAGNLMLQHNHNDFPSDMVTILAGIGAQITLRHASNGGSTVVTPLSLMKTDMSMSVIESMFIPYSISPDEQFHTFKIAQRHQNSHAFVNAAFKVQIAHGTITETPTLIYGGLQAHALSATKTAQLLKGKSVASNSLLQSCCTQLLAELPLDSSFGRDAYRKQLITSFFYKFFLALQASLPPSLQSAAATFERGVSTGQISYDTKPIEYPVSEPVPKVSGVLQASGEARYADDVPKQEGELWGAFVLSTVGKADLKSIDASVALKMPGVVDFFSAEDIKGKNNCDPNPGLSKDCYEELFASEKIVFNGQSIGLIVARTLVEAQAAAKAVKVTYANQQTPIITNDDALNAKSFYPNNLFQKPVGPIVVGDVNTGFANSDVVFEGSIELPIQYHFTMETQTTVAIPEEGSRLRVVSSTQWPAIEQMMIHRILQIPSNSISVDTRRVGGAYGGKITRSIPIAVAAALAAQKLRRTVRIPLSIEDNMHMVGKRHGWKFDYKVGVNNDGSFQALDLHYYNNGGWTFDATAGTMTMAITTSDNTYMFPNFAVKGTMLRTNLPTNTSMRAPGCAPSLFLVEHVIEHTANVLKMDSVQLREKNFYKQGDTTPFGSILDYYNMPTVWSQLKQSSNYQQRSQDVDTWNKNNRWIKKGISIVPIKYGITYAGAHYGALVSILSDGTVQINQSGIESGQGLNTKVIQVAAKTLRCSMDFITVTTSSTQVVPNGLATGGSITSELCARAVKTACETLVTNLAPIRKVLGLLGWADVCLAAFGAGVELQASAWCNPGTETDNGDFVYQTYGAACSEVQIDTLTGETQILRSDILYDCGQSLNPAIDIGQVEGGFVTAIGQYLTEEVLYGKDGRVLNPGTWEYKPPSSQDIPIDLRASLLKNAPNPKGFLSSKASGEPPLCLACSVFFAVQKAIAACAEQSLTPPTGYLSFDPPACPPVVQQQCQIDFSQFTIN